MFGNKEQEQLVALQERTTGVRSFIATSEKNQIPIGESASGMIDSVNEFLKLKPEQRIFLPDSVDVVLNEAIQSFDEYAALVASRIDFKARRIKMPYAQKEADTARMADLAFKVESAWKVTEAIRLGYNPYTEANPFYVERLSRRFDHSMPVEDLEKLRQAQEAQLFSRFIYVLADQSFSHCHEPAIVGFIATERSGLMLKHHEKTAERKPLLEVDNGIGFLVVQWDTNWKLNQDLQNNTQTYKLI